MCEHMWRKGNPHALIQSLWKTLWKFPPKSKIALVCGPAISLLGIYPKQIKTLIQKYAYTFMLFAALFTIAKIWKTPKFPSMVK